MDASGVDALGGDHELHLAAFPAVLGVYEGQEPGVQGQDQDVGGEAGPGGIGPFGFHGLGNRHAREVGFAQRTEDAGIPNVGTKVGFGANLLELPVAGENAEFDEGFLQRNARSARPVAKHSSQRRTPTKTTSYRSGRLIRAGNICFTTGAWTMVLERRP